MSNRTPLMAIIHNEIRAAGGRITFAQFMELCLYHPLYGYYNTERVKLGKDGDFYTSAHTGPVFARLLAKHFDLLWNELGKPARFDLVELGPGDGSFTIELLPWIAKRFPKLAPHFNYTAVEQSPVLRARLAASLRRFGGRVRILAELPPPVAGAAKREGSIGCVLANEFFDAFPFHILRWRGGRWYERYVCVTEDDLLLWSNQEPSAAWLVDAAEQCYDPTLSRTDQEDGRSAEIAPLVTQWMERIGNWLGRGEALVVDYGHSSEEWQAGRFPEGSGLAYRQHQVMEDLLADPGEQDLTAHVNFSQLVDAGKQNGLRLHQMVSQEKFLMQLGEPDEFHDVFSDCNSEAERQQRAQLLKTLILPQGMGTTFQVLQFRKGM
jgi:SAM-dependent MidA family methyltransferase